MRFIPLVCVFSGLILIGCGGSSEASTEQGARPVAGAVKTGASKQSAFVEGKDYIVMERRRFLDAMGFDRPVEAYSMLFPKGWKVEGGVRWLSVQQCRGDMVSNYVKASSPDGAIRYDAMPSRSFNWAGDQFMQQALLAGAQAGGCGVNQPFDAARYVDGFARKDLAVQSVEVVNLEVTPQMRQLDEQANAIARQYGNDSQQHTTRALGNLKWPDGDEGILDVGVMGSVTRKRNMVTGGVDTDALTSVFYCVVIRFPAARKAEATQMFGMIQSSFRQNPIWRQAKEQFMTQLGNAEHAGRMEKLRLMGEQSRAYAKSQSDASDRQMRDWESQQASQDRQQKSFVQTIREVETWKDASGSVELSSGYGQAWSRGDGSYILSNTPSFNPSSVFQDQKWQEMKRAKE